jgi:hypothetical protein
MTTSVNKNFDKDIVSIYELAEFREMLKPATKPPEPRNSKIKKYITKNGASVSINGRERQKIAKRAKIAKTFGILTKEWLDALVMNMYG